MKKYNIDKLINKYNKILSKRYGCDVEMQKESYYGTIDSLEALLCDCVCDGEQQYLECDYLRKYFYYKIIKDYIKDFEEYDKEAK